MVKLLKNKMPKKLPQEIRDAQYRIDSAVIRNDTQQVRDRLRS